MSLSDPASGIPPQFLSQVPALTPTVIDYNLKAEMNLSSSELLLARVLHHSTETEREQLSDRPRDGARDDFILTSRVMISGLMMSKRSRPLLFMRVVNATSSPRQGGGWSQVSSF